MRRSQKIQPALKHGGYSALGLLSGEDPAAFEKLHKGLIAELAPNGPLEEDIVLTIARLVWRKQNLGTFQRAEMARNRLDAIELATRGEAGIGPGALGDQDMMEEIAQSVARQARRELGDLYQLVGIGRNATVEGLQEELDVEDRLDARIGRSLKQLTYLRGLKSLALPAQIAPPPASEHIANLPTPMGEIATTSCAETVDNNANLPAPAAESAPPPGAPDTLVMVDGPPLGTNELEEPINPEPMVVEGQLLETNESEAPTSPKMTDAQPTVVEGPPGGTNKREVRSTPTPNRLSPWVD
jgi:hypothetical protein